MRILITGRPASGKSLYASHLSSRYKHIIYEADNFTDFNALTDKVKNLENCIVVIQHKKFLTEKLEFDLHFECTRYIDDLDNFYVTSSSGTQKCLFSDFLSDPRAGGVPAN